MQQAHVIKKIRTALDNVKNHGWGLVDLRNCGLKEIPLELFNYPDLVNLDFGNDPYCPEDMKNIIGTIPDEIISLKKLAKIDLENNCVVYISEHLSSLKGLIHLNLKNNSLTELPVKVANMGCLKQLELEGNPFEMLPPEIVARGIESVRNFFKELEEQDFLYEVKLIIVGEGRVGKTCLSKALINSDYKLGDEESTEGIKINSWIIPKDEINKINPKIQRDFQINIWDFGGQEIYHSTHQFFLTKRSIYMLVTESRKEDSHDDFFYWLNIIKLLGDKSPVIMVLNKSDQPTKDLPIKEYRDTFNNIKGFEKLSLKEGYEDTVQHFKNTLKQIASTLPHIGSPLPKRWVEIRQEIEILKLSGLNYISEGEYFEICKKHYRKEENALYLSDFFHDLGVFLHFRNDIDLKETVILNHEWITSGVYNILDDKQVIAKKGRFSNEDLIRIWSNDEHKNKIRELLSLMKNKKFDLCFELPNGEYLVPRLLPVDEIEHSWAPQHDNLKFEFRYKFMPKGILTRLIVKMNNDIYNDQYWRYGVILQYENTQAIIKEKYFENKITIELSGNNKREYLFIIRKAINEIHKDFNNIQVQEMVPCICSHCKTVEETSFFDFELLLRYELKKIATIRCNLSLDEVSVTELTNYLGQISVDRLVFCENKNAEVLQKLLFKNVLFYGEKDSSSVFIKMKTKAGTFGLRDRDFLLDSEIQKIRKKYPNYFILDYYCFENYLLHPNNLMELKLNGLDIGEYIGDIVRQKNLKKNYIMSIYRNSRNNYQEFKIELENLRSRNEEDEIISYLQSDNMEIFFKAFSMKDHFDKTLINKYNLKVEELANTEWFKTSFTKILEFDYIKNQSNHVSEITKVHNSLKSLTGLNKGVSF